MESNLSGDGIAAGQEGLKATDRLVVPSISPLPDPKRYIRLLQILPGHDKDKIRCSATIRMLDEVEANYVAISYVWAEPVFDKVVEIDGNDVNITSGAHLALWQMRHHHADVAHLYWIDSICINQADNDEKSAQIRIMYQIFSQARFVAACLGPSSEDFMDRIDVYVDDLCYASPEDLECLDYDPWQGVTTHLSGLSYFDRLWVVQEVALARTVVLFLGSRVRFHESVFNDEVREISHSPCAELLQMRKQWHRYGNEPVEELLKRYKSRKCARYHDKLYGLLALSPAREHVKVDYDQSLLEFVHSFLMASACRTTEVLRECFLPVFLKEHAFHVDAYEFLCAMLEAGSCGLALPSKVAGPAASGRLPFVRELEPTKVHQIRCFKQSDIDILDHKDIDNPFWVSKINADVIPMCAYLPAGKVRAGDLLLDIGDEYSVLARPNDGAPKRLDILGWAWTGDWTKELCADCDSHRNKLTLELYIDDLFCLLLMQALIADYRRRYGALIHSATPVALPISTESYVKVRVGRTDFFRRQEPVPQSRLWCSPYHEQ